MVFLDSTTYTEISYKMNILLPRKSTDNHAFTIVELLIVIVVIGILATITIVAYNGLRTKAVTSSLQSDLEQNQKIIQIYAAQNNDQFPTGQSDAVANGLKSSSNILSYRWITGNNYCMIATNSSSSTAYYVTNTMTTPAIGTCPVVINTFVGSSSGSGYVNASGTNARFNGVNGIAFDASGNLFISDFNNNSIRKSTPSGVVTTAAGSGIQGSANGTSATAQFNYPTGLAFDSVGNLYIADSNNNSIRKMTPDGTVTTFAGTGVAGYADGSGASSQFKSPNGIVVDSYDNLYVADVGNSRIRKITSSGIVSTFAGSGVAGSLDGTGTNAKISPVGIGIDTSGNLYVSTFTPNIRKITPAAVVTTLIGPGPIVKGPQFIKVDASGTLYVTDVFSLSVYTVTQSGVATIIAGNGTQGFVNGLATASSFSGPSGIAIDQSGVIFVADNLYIVTLLR